jgi:hypothetical protein
VSLGPLQAEPMFDPDAFADFCPWRLQSQPMSRLRGVNWPTARNPKPHNGSAMTDVQLYDGSGTAVPIR